MKIKLTDIPIFLITIESAKDRHNKVNQICADVGLKNIQHINGKILDKTNLSFEQIQKKKSSLVAEAHIEALTKVKPPFLILEDDVNITESFKPEIEIPENSDCLYLGSSIWGYKNSQSMANASSGTKINTKLCKVKNMLGIHSIVYLTESYINYTIQNLNKCIQLNQYCDECIAQDMENHNVYCVNYPYFYQNDGHNDMVTVIPFGVYLK